jgi:LmbE family N-acetylglucosaminyl deacetylase
MTWAYLSPHFDDVVLSCGGLIWEQLQNGESVEIWTICAGVPRAGEPYSDFAHHLHARWQTGPEAVPARRQEDEAAVRTLGARMRYWDLPDCIYRRLPDGTFLVNGEEDLWQPAHPQEAGVIERLKIWLALGLEHDTRLVCPMTLGSHVDHHLVRAAAESLGRPLWYYADFPYVRQFPESLPAMLRPEWQKDCYPITRQALEAWQCAIAHYSSQISTFWHGVKAMRADLDDFWQSGGGSCLWKAGE